MTLGLLFTSVVLGMRHGIDWDHIAAITDLTSSADSRRRGILLSGLYAFGHAAVVFVLGAALIVAGRSLPDGITVWMGRVVGLTLVCLGAWILIQLALKRSAFRLQSRWMLIINGTFAGMRKVRGTRSERHVDVEHEHGHDHDDGGEHENRQAHDHSHLSADVALPVEVGVVAAASNLTEENQDPRAGTHIHRHSHQLALPNDPSVGYGARTATGIGMLHGVGVESPTQIALFVASTSIVGAWFGLLLLAGWIAGLVFANFAVALLAGFGLLHAERNFKIYAAVAIAIGVTSIVMGLTFVLGTNVLPEITP